MDKQTFISEGRRYLELGYSIIPCYNVFDNKTNKWDKRPLVEWKQFQTRRPTVEEVEYWAERFIKPGKDVNLGIVTGGISGVVVVDFDTQEAYDEYKEKYGLDTTPQVITGRGYHLYFKYPNRAINNSAGKIANKVDLRGDGGFAVLPPSVHYSGRQYAWQVQPEDAPLAPLPEWVLKHYIPNYTKKDNGTQEESKAKSSGAKVSSEGSRNHDLYVLTQQVRRMGIPKSVALATVGAYNVTMCNPPLDETEVDKIISSAYKDGETKEYPRTDAGNAERLADKHFDMLAYVEDMKSWFYYDGKRWNPRGEAAVHNMALQVVRNIPSEIPEDAPPAVIKSYKGFALGCESTGKLTAMIKQAQFKMNVLYEKFDSNDWIFNVQNGVIDLKTGKFREHSSTDYVSKLGGAMYDPAAKCPIWEKFVYQMFGEDKDLVRYFQKALGYSITGSVKEQKFFVLNGSGGNGKSTLLEAVKHVIGDYGIKAEFNTFTTKTNDPIRNDVARMAGARFVTASESNPGKELDSSLVKELTGGDTITARFLFKDYFEFRPTFKLFLATNHKPRIRDDSEGMWRRMRFIPCNLKLEEKDKDIDLPNKLYAERSGILNWILEGCKLWQAEGLGESDTVVQATQEYREESDVLKAFMDECTEVGDETLRLSKKELFKAYVKWCDDGKQYTWPERTLNTKLKQKGYAEIKSNGVMMWKGLRLTEPF